MGNTGADGIEIYTGTYAAAFRAGDGSAELRACAETASRAGALGLVVNAGHDLNLRNLPGLVAALPNLAEASIGHELTADALEIGFAAAVRAYKAALAGSRPSRVRASAPASGRAQPAREGEDEEQRACRDHGRDKKGTLRRGGDRVGEPRDLVRCREAWRASGREAG